MTSASRTLDPRLVVLATVALCVPALVCAEIWVGRGDLGRAALASSLSPGGVALLAAVGMAVAAARASGRVRRVWAWLSAGAAVWALGSLLYAVFILTGGDYANPAAWSQVGYLLAYVPWLRGLWLLRQPVVAESFRRRVETIAVEVASLAVLGTAVFGVLWQEDLNAASNVALLVPIALDMLLVAAAYNAVRRTALDVASAYPWLISGLGLLVVSDAATSYAVSHALPRMAPVATTGYSVAMALLAYGAGRALVARELGLAGERVTAALAIVALAEAGPAAVVAPPWARPVVWVGGVLLAWRVHALLRRQGRTDEDPITGTYDARAMTRHMAGILAGASAREPVAVLGVDLTGFGAWNSGNGFAAGDALLSEVAEACVSAPIGPGVWGRVGPDRFCWVGRCTDLDQARDWAALCRSAAAANRAGLRARAAVVMAPADAGTAANALDALAEALEAAAITGRDVVAFDRGLLDGAAIEGRYSASFRSRRSRVAEVIGDPNGIVSVFQPIVRLADLGVEGHEVLSRVNREPRRGPDQWIAEAHQVGLGLEIESACVRVGTRARTLLPRGTYMSVNMSPQLILSGLVEDLLPDGRLDWLMIEITEHEQVRDYSQLAHGLREVRARGAHVAVDDLGAGHSTLRHLMRLSPDVAKLDRSLVEAIDRDGAKQALVRSMVAFSREMGCRLVAEGVETLAELEVLRSLEVELGQGYLFRHPEPEMVADITPREGLGPSRAPAAARLAVIPGGRGAARAAEG